MITLETIQRNVTAQKVRVVEATPEALREAADRIETMMREGYQSGDSVLCPFSPTIMLLYKPELQARLHFPAVESETIAEHREESQS